jgi:hypothetical protein
MSLKVSEDVAVDIPFYLIAHISPKPRLPSVQGRERIPPCFTQAGPGVNMVVRALSARAASSLPRTAFRRVAGRPALGFFSSCIVLRFHTTQKVCAPTAWSLHGLAMLLDCRRYCCAQGCRCLQRCGIVNAYSFTSHSTSIAAAAPALASSTPTLLPGCYSTSGDKTVILNAHQAS